MIDFDQRYQLSCLTTVLCHVERAVVSFLSIPSVCIYNWKAGYMHVKV